MSIYCGNRKIQRVLNPDASATILWVEDVDQVHYCTVSLFVAYCISKGVFENSNEMFDDTLDRSFKVCELKEEFADMDVFDMNQPQYAKSFNNAYERAGFPAAVPTPYAIRRGTISERSLQNAQPLPEFMLRFDQSNLKISKKHYHTREIHTQSQEERRGWEVTAADLCISTQNYKGHHPGRLKK